MTRPEPATPQLCLGLVRHKRLRPVVHAFEYGIYFVRLPLRALQQQAQQKAQQHTGFSSRLFSRNRFNLLSFFDSDHGDGRQPLLTWVDGLLKAEGVPDADGEIWLQTMPRVLGYVFNPVSFWFCHRADGALRAVVCDVRNTFGEHHFYLLEKSAGITYGSELEARKIFHVSPFCPVEGRYRFRFMKSDRMRATTAQQYHLACIDYDDNLGPLLETSLSGQAVAISDWSVASAFLRYPLMSFGVIARIHIQALRLWLRRVPLFSKPAPPTNEVTR
jgi:DUF1365 family protein